jgi:radical SAM protein with 4Fe4S-binding SPASM domain
VGNLLQIDSPALRKRRDDATSEAKAREERKARWQHLRPTQAHITIENRCHLKCEHCFESEQTHPHEDAYALTLEDYERVFDELAQMGVLYVTLTGGEIFLRKDLFDIIDAARQRRFAVTLYTSGTPITPEKADRLAALKVHEVQISLYSHDPAVHDRFTGTVGSHARSVRALKLLHERGVRTMVKSNVMTFNVEHLDELIALAKDVGADYQLDPTVKPKMNGDTSPLKFRVPAETVQKLVYSRPDLYAAFRRRAPEEYCTGEASLLDQKGHICGAGYAAVSIGAEGGVYACNFFPEAAGNLKDSSLTDVWFGAEQLDGVRQTTFDKMHDCGSCKLNTTCMPCMAYSLVENDDHLGCSTPAKQGAEQLRALAEARVRAERKMERGTALPLVGETTAPPPPLKSGAAGLSTE